MPDVAFSTAPGVPSESSQHAGFLPVDVVGISGRAYHVAALDFLGTGGSERISPWLPTWWELGAEQAAFGLIAWGSTYGVLRDWVREHPEYRVFLPEILEPITRPAS